MTYIKKISMTGFKSFGDRTVTIRLSSGFTCIVGPNGAGKSNIIDALTFALGRLSKKTMRAKSLEDLIFAGARGKNPSNRASVSLYFDNSENIFPGGGDTFEITRIIKRGGGGGYKMNGNKVQRTQILSALAAANIDPDGSNQFVLQGKIVEMTHMNPEERRVFIEELIGLQKYDEMKDATIKELEKAERDLGQFEAIFKEVSSQLKKVEKEKNDAIAWKELDEKIRLYNAQLIALNISKLRQEEDELEKKLEESNKIIEELKEKLTRQDELLSQESLVMENIQKTILEKEKEREAINENITQIRTQLSSTQTSINLGEKSITKLNQEIKQLESLQLQLEGGQTLDSLIEALNTEITEKENSLESYRKEIETRQQQQAEFEKSIKANDDLKSTHQVEISNLKQAISSNKAQIKILKENIKKNEDKRIKLEEDLSKLKGDYEDVDEAIKATNQEASRVRKKIEDYKAQIEQENLRQKDLEKSILALREEKSKLNTELSNFQSSLSSQNTEIKITKERIDELQKKKIDFENKIRALSKGKNTEDALKEMLKQRDGIIKQISELKSKAREEDSRYRKNEQNLDLLIMKQDALEAEINDNKMKIENINTKSKLIKRELTGLEREKKDLELKINSLESNLADHSKESANLSNKQENIKRRLEELTTERDNFVKKIESSDKEYERNTEDISGILQILNMLTQNINISVESIKSNIQQSNAEAIEYSAEDFRKFVLDIVDIMKTVEGVNAKSEDQSEMTQSLNSILQTLMLFTENVDGTIDQLIQKVKESADIEIQQSTTNFDQFVQDLMEILENVYLSLRKLTMSKSQELYKQLDEITSNITSQNEELSEIERELAKIKIMDERDSETLSINKKRLEVIAGRINEINEDVNKYDEEVNQRMETIKIKEDDNISLEIKNLKDLKNQYWEQIAGINDKVESKQKDLDKIQQNMQELRGIQNIFDGIVEIERDVQDLENSIESKKKTLLLTEENLKKVRAEIKAKDDKISALNEEKETFWENTEKIRGLIEEENQSLQEIMDRLRGLKNIMMIINSIADLTAENTEANKNIEKASKDIDQLNIQETGIQQKIDEVQQKIDKLRADKDAEIDAQKEAQKKLNALNKELRKTQDRLNELNQNKERELKMISLREDIKDTEKQMKTYLTQLKKFENELEQLNVNKGEKQEEIDKLSKEKDNSWKKQKSFQKIVNDLKADLSMENSKINNYESKKIITTDQIETLYQRSKEYGALPAITDDLSETGLQSDINDANNKKKALEPVNLKAIEQFDSVKERFDEIDMRRQTIQRERKSIMDAIEKIELEKTRTFMKAYHEINREFSRIFQKLSPGGSAKMILDRPDKPFEGGVSIEARPRGKKISSLEILSGGEKTLVALSFIFAVQEFYPAPFYILDEIDAALDGPNVHRVSITLKEFAKQAQFLVISHREENIVNADRIYGVSMQQSGITDVFSVDLEEEAKRLLDLPDVPPQMEEN